MHAFSGRLLTDGGRSEQAMLPHILWDRVCESEGRDVLVGFGRMVRL
jgi:hypothetical protein